ncbi:hypothetical protein ABZY44_13020 [Streptomyces sp. NPDC006544]|uniref:hypothetical protein n=1 Tax=Streptomyces sp. NPDC006544 TaxID=3154583 RepID=UPI0033A16198
MPEKTGRWVRVVVLGVLSACSVALIAGCGPDKDDPTVPPSPSDTVSIPSGAPQPTDTRGAPDAVSSPPASPRPTATGEPYVPPPPPPPVKTADEDGDPSSAPSASPSPQQPTTPPAQIDPPDPDGT